MSEEVKLLHLHNNDMIIAYVSESKDSKEYLIRKPFVMAMDNNRKLSMIPYNPVTRDEVLALNKASVLYVCSALQSLEDEFRKNTSDIIQPNSGLIV